MPSRPKSTAFVAPASGNPIPVVDVISTSSASERTSDRSIPFGRPIIGDEEREAVMKVLSGTTLTHGPQVQQFEAAFADFTKAPHALATSSCTAALHLAYMFAQIGPGDEVIMPAQTHIATAHAVELCGARCVFIDSEPSTGNLDLDQLEQAITSRTKAICVVHYLGLPVDMTRVMSIAQPHNLLVIEDCALAIGATLDDIHVGLHGDVGCFSFYPVKHITTAEGGMLITRREDLAAAASSQRAFGIDRNIVSDRPTPGEYDVTHLGNNYRMNEIGAAIGLVQMSRLPQFLADRRANYEALATGLASIEEVRLLQSTHGRFRSSYYGLALMLSDRLISKRPQIMAHLKNRGVGFSVYYPRPVPHMSYYRRRYGFADSSFAVASRLSAASITLPVGPHLMREDVKYIVASVKDAIAAVR